MWNGIVPWLSLICVQYLIQKSWTFRILQRPALPTLQSEFSCACNLLCAEISAEIACVVSERMGLSLSVGNLH